MHQSQLSREEHEYMVVLPMYELKPNTTNMIDPAFRKVINSKFIVQFAYGFSGKMGLVGFGQLHKKIGMDGVELAESIAHEALKADQNKFTKVVEGRFTIIFKKRKNGNSKV